MWVRAQAARSKGTVSSVPAWFRIKSNWGKLLRVDHVARQVSAQSARTVCARSWVRVPVGPCAFSSSVTHAWVSIQYHNCKPVLHVPAFIVYNRFLCPKPLSEVISMITGPRQANLVLIAYASSEGSGESAHSRSLARTFAARSYKQ